MELLARFARRLQPGRAQINGRRWIVLLLRGELIAYKNPEEVRRKDAKAQSFTEPLNCKESGFSIRRTLRITDFLCVTWRLCVFAVMNCGFQDERHRG